ncbi:hypothetical protein AOT96_29205 [Rhodococcus sp. 008]|nr:hypothetical protein AOT96_29205 [Rhodococcus sp. 008]
MGTVTYLGTPTLATQLLERPDESDSNDRTARQQNMPAFPAPSLLSTTTLNAATATPRMNKRTAYQFMPRMKA